MTVCFAQSSLSCMAVKATYTNTCVCLAPVCKFAYGTTLISLIPVDDESYQRELLQKDSPFFPLTVL